MAITLTGGVGTRGAGEVVQRTSANGASDLRLAGTFATQHVASVEARVVVAGGSVAVTDWTRLADLAIGGTSFEGRFRPAATVTYSISALSAANPLRLTITSGRHMIEERRTASVRINGNGAGTGTTLDGTYTATGTEAGDVLWIPVSNVGSIYQANGTITITRAAEVPIGRALAGKGAVAAEAGLWYNWQVRTKDSAGVVLETLNATVDWGVGILLHLIGQSNIGQSPDKGLFYVADAPTRDAADPQVSWWNGTAWAKLTTTPAGNGIHRLLNVVQEACTEQGVIITSNRATNFGNIPIGAIHGGMGSAALIEAADFLNGGAWLDRTGGPYTTARSRLIAGTDKTNVEAVLWQQGETEAQAAHYGGDLLNLGEKYRVGPGEYQQGLITLYDRLRSGGDAYTSPVQDVMPFLVAPPVRLWADWAHAASGEIGSPVMQTHWPVVVADGLEFAHRNGEPDTTRRIKRIITTDGAVILGYTPSGELGAVTLLELDGPHGIEHTGPIRIEGQSMLSGVPATGPWQVDINGAWIAERVDETTLLIPQSSIYASGVTADGRVVVERGPCYASTRNDETDSLHVTAAGAMTLGDKMARSIARRCGIEGNRRPLSITNITAVTPADTPVVTFSTAHGLPLFSVVWVYFSGTDSTPVINGWRSVLVQGATTVQLNTSTATLPENGVVTTVAGATGTGRIPGRRDTGFSLRGPRIVAAVFGDELTGTVAADQARDKITLYVKHDRGRVLTYDALTVLQSFEFHDEIGPMAVTAIAAGGPATTEGGLQRFVLTLERNTAATEAIALDPYFAPDRCHGSFGLLRYGQFASLPSSPPANDALMFDDAAGMALPLLPTFGHLVAGQPRGQVPLSPLVQLPARSQSYIITTIAATATAVTTTIAGQQHATEFWRYIGNGSRMIRPGDRWFQITVAGVRINEGTVRAVTTYTGPAANVVLTLDRSVTTTDGNYLLIGSEFDGACSLLATSREGASMGG